MSVDVVRSLVERESAPRLPFGTGVVVGTVVNNSDPEGLGRVKVKFPWLDDLAESAWARIAAPMAGDGRGVYFVPEVDDEVLIAFGHGDVRFPYVVGCLWNGTDKPPVDNVDGKNDVRVIRSRSGHVIRLNDKPGGETVEIVDASGKSSIVIDTAQNHILVVSEKDITLSAPKGTIALHAKYIEIESTADTLITAEGQANVAADGDVTIEGKTVNLN